LHWNNSSPHTINELQFHLYLNAFRGPNSTFMKESGGKHRGFGKKENIWGWTNINKIKIVEGADLTDSIKFYQPDDNNEDDKSVVRVTLAEPLLPNKDILLEIDFTSKLPNIFARTGFTKNYYLVAQWFPKIGVYEKAGQRYAEKGAWNCHQFHANSEFYADFGVYNVELRVPQNYIVGATGLLEFEKNNEDGTKYLLFHAEDVIDFVWTASPDFVIAEGSWEHVKIKVFLPQDKLYLANRILESAINSLQYLDKYIGKYPYPNLTIVDPPFYGRGSGGMEYPTFITTRSIWGFPKGIKMLEETTAHEVVHNYFQALIATNEFEEPWMDEGFTQYFENRIMDETYGSKRSRLDLFGFNVGAFESSRSGFVGMRNPSVSDNSPYAWEYPLRSYGVLSYNKTSTWLVTLENLIGRDVIDEVFQTYFERWKFKHPSGKNFIELVNEIVAQNYGEKFGKNLNWFFDQVLYGAGVCDYKIHSIKYNLENVEKIQLENEELERRNYNRKKIYTSEVVVYRVGDVKLPVELLVQFNDGREILELWDGQDRIRKFTYKSEHKIVWAKVDPNFKIKLDVNLLNNSYTLEPETSVINKYAAKVLFWMENFMLSFGVFF